MEYYIGRRFDGWTGEVSKRWTWAEMTLGTEADRVAGSFAAAASPAASPRPTTTAAIATSRPSSTTTAATTTRVAALV